MAEGPSMVSTHLLDLKRCWLLMLTSRARTGTVIVQYVVTVPNYQVQPELHATYQVLLLLNVRGSTVSYYLQNKPGKVSPTLQLST